MTPLTQDGLKLTLTKLVRQCQRLKHLEPFDVVAHVAGIRLERRLAQPHEPGDAHVGRHVEQVVQGTSMVPLQRIGQRAVDTTLARVTASAQARSITLNAGMMIRFSRSVWRECAASTMALSVCMTRSARLCTSLRKSRSPKTDSPR